MQKTFLVAVCFIAALNLHGQYSVANESEGDYPKFYLGVGTGINSYTGLLGLSGNLRIKNTFFVQGGLGLGAWGYKSSIGLRYDMNYEKGWSYGVGVSSNSGLRDFKTDLEVDSGNTQEVTMDLLKAYTLNLKASHNWKVGAKNTFYLEFGTAIALQSTPWRITDGSTLSSTSEDVLALLSPGGFILGLGFTFGL